MGDLAFIFNALVGGLFALFQDLTQSYYYSLPALVAAISVFVLVCAALGKLSRPDKRKFAPNYWAFAVAGAMAGAVAVILRVALGRHGYILFLAGIDAFGLHDLTQITYLLFATTGAVAGLIIAHFARGKWGVVGGAIGLSIGSLYHLQVAEGWWSASLFGESLKVIGQSIAPIAGALLFTKLFSSFVERQGKNSYNRSM